LFLSIRELELRKIRFDADFPAGEIEFPEALRQVTALHAEGEAELLSNTLGEVRVHGHLKVVMEVDCDRCLEPTKVPIDAPFDLFYRPLMELTGHHEVAIDTGETEIGFYEDGGIELAEVLSEQVLLSMPMQQVCSENCQGICPQCGKNKNQGACRCEVKLVDNRWEALQGLKLRFRSSSE